MFLEIIGKLLSESLLSLYPIFVKNIGLSIPLQMWSRFFSYAIISLFFVDATYIQQNILSYNGLLLSFVTIAHIYTSYRGFQLLESGIAYTLFYLYPIMILLLAKKAIHPILLVSLVGVYLLSSSTPSPNIHTNDMEGLVMILGAAFTEALIYFIVLNLKTENNWNHIFLSYYLGAALFTGFMFQQISKLTIESMLSISLGINAIIGLLGYLLRFYAISRLDTTTYASLSYFGIFMAYVYGVLINNDTITIQKIFGTLCIIIPNLYLLFVR